MAKWLLISVLLILSIPTFADVNSDIAKCLGGGSSTSAGSKASCVQTAINNATNNQITTLFQIYANFTNQGIGYYGSSAGTNTPTGGSGNSVGSSSGQGVTPPTIPKPQPSAPTTPKVPLPSVNTPAQPQQNQNGGIQYY